VINTKIQILLFTGSFDLGSYQQYQTVGRCENEYYSCIVLTYVGSTTPSPHHSITPSPFIPSLSRYLASFSKNLSVIRRMILQSDVPK
jgi:hypothetical protein